MSIEVHSDCGVRAERAGWKGPGRGAPGEAECGWRTGLDDGAAVCVAARAGREWLLVEVDHYALPALLLLSDRSRHPSMLLLLLLVVALVQKLEHCTEVRSTELESDGGCAKRGDETEERRDRRVGQKSELLRNLRESRAVE